MRALVYEGRRLLGVRTTWLIVLATLGTAAVAAAVASRQADAGPLSVSQSVPLLTAAVPLLPLPIVTLGAGAIGALSYGHEVCYPVLRASLVAPHRRLQLLAAKMTVIGAASAVLASASLAVNALVLRGTLPPGVDRSGLLDADGLPRALLGFVVLVVATAWVCLFAAGLLRSAAAGMMVLLALPTAAEPALDALLSQSDSSWAERFSMLLPFRVGHGWVYVDRGSRGPLSSDNLIPIGVTLLPALVLLLACVVAQLRRRVV